MQAGHGYFDQIARKSQCSQLCDFVQKFSKNQHPKWLIGDLNLFPLKMNQWGYAPVSPHANDEADARQRSECYDFILEKTGLVDVHPTDGVYRIFSNYQEEIPVTYLPSNGYTDGPYLTVNLPV
jgi:hypothetical protein